ncbi:BnaA08g28970D [Brassica napus]|uniref:BnaA08g28970D protein n=1 Tax=Brassica napus TaxID=3708 RepID=A0A078FTI7_BRANA|nr:BnaA08g28970D [Brassica napus]
MLVCWHKHDS